MMHDSTVDLLRQTGHTEEQIEFHKQKFKEIEKQILVEALESLLERVKNEN